MTRRDLPFLLALAAAVFILHARVLTTDEVYFVHDLTNVNHPWRAMAADQILRGQLPLWNPYSYMGLPLLGNFQTGLFFPLSLLFDLFPFACALKAYLSAAYMLAAAGAYLWLRSLRLPRRACLGGASLFAAGGYMLSHLQFLNLLGTLALFPWLFLLGGETALLGLASALALLAGYPPIWAGMTAAQLALGWVWAPGREARTLVSGALGAALGCLLAALVLVPGLELASLSTRRVGIEAKERTDLSLEPYELTTLIHPALTRWWSRRSQEPHPEKEQVVWTRHGRKTTFTFFSSTLDPLEDSAGIKVTPWKSGYLGALASAAAVLGGLALAARSPRRGAALALYLLACALLVLGRSHGASRWLWETLTPLSFLRGPARLSYLFLAAAAPAAAWGLARARPLAARLWAFGILTELVVLGLGFYPTLPSDYFRERGALADYLQPRLGGLRYFQYPAIEMWPYVNKKDPSPEYREFQEAIFRTYKQKLFGVSNAPFRLAAASGGYEPLVPAASAALIDSLAMEKAVPETLRRLGIRYVLDRAPIKGTALLDRGERLWRTYEVAGPVSEAWFGSAPWEHDRPREDRLAVRGRAPQPGTLFLAEPFYPGWEAYVNGRRSPVERAQEAFRAVQVPAGDVKVDLLYRPWSWILGLWITLAALGGLVLWNRIPS